MDDIWVKLGSFPNCLERLLLLSQNVRSFRLHCRKDVPSDRTTQRITALLRRNVEFLQIVYQTYGGSVVLPRNLLDSTSLRELILSLPCTLKVSSGNYFPNLSSLYLYKVEFQNLLSNSDTLILTFLVLETLKLDGCKWLNVKFVEIHAPKRKKFVTETPRNTHVCDYTKYYKPEEDYSIKIVADRLVHFESWGGIPENLILNVSFVVCATFQHVEKPRDRHFAHGLKRLESLFERFQSLEDLELHGWTWNIALSKQRLTPPMYEKLRRLTLFGGSINIKSLLELLHVTPSLKALVFNMYCSSAFWPDHLDYEGLESLPSCIVSNLEEVEVIYDSVLVSKYRLERFLLKNELKLKTFHLCGGYHNKSEIVKLLSEFPKGSTSLTIRVT